MIIGLDYFLALLRKGPRFVFSRLVSVFRHAVFVFINTLSNECSIRVSLNGRSHLLLSDI